MKISALFIGIVFKLLVGRPCQFTHETQAAHAGKVPPNRLSSRPVGSSSLPHISEIHSNSGGGISGASSPGALSVLAGFSLCEEP